MTVESALRPKQWRNKNMPDYRRPKPALYTTVDVKMASTLCVLRRGVNIVC